MQRTVAQTRFISKVVKSAEHAWKELVLGVVIGAGATLIIKLAWPLLVLVSAAVSSAPFQLSPWPPNGTLILVILTVGVLLLVTGSIWRSMKRWYRSWTVGLVTGTTPIAALVAALILGISGSSRFHHPLVYILLGFGYIAATIAVSVATSTEISPATVMQTLNIPRDQLATMRSNVLEDDSFVSVLENPNPITEWSADWIGRAPFAERVLQRVIVGREPIVAISGGFGEGKSSLLHLLAIALRPLPSIIPVPFSSLLPGDENTLVASLMSSITLAIRERYIVPELRKTFVRYARTIVGALPKVGDSLKDLLKQPSQSEEIAGLKALLRRIPVQVVVLLDEIDRLQEDELRTVFKLLRGISDLPRICYICAFNKDSLAQIAKGYEYLEKFFPVELPLPKIDEETLRNLFLIRLNALRRQFADSSPDADKQFNETWEMLWLAAGKQYFSNLRRLSTYFKNLESEAQTIAEEVNFFDMSVLEAVRQVSPAAFEFIYSHGKLFYFPGWRLSLWPEQIGNDESETNKEIKRELDQFFSSLGIDVRELIIELLTRIFPNVATYRREGRFVLGAPSRDANEAERAKRIYHPDFFHRYFIYDVPASLYGEQEMTAFLRRADAAKTQDAVAEVLSAEMKILDKVPLRRSDFFDRLPLASDKLDKRAAELLAYAIADQSSSLGEDFLGAGEEGRARAVVFATANRFADSSRAHDILEETVRRASSDAFASDLVFYSVNRDRNNIIRNWQNVDTPKLQAAFATRMRLKYSPDRDQPIPNCRGVLRAFFSWSNISEAERQYLSTYLRNRFSKSPAEVASFIAWLFPGDVAYDKDPSAVVNRLIPVEEVREAAQDLGSRIELTGVQLEALKRFQQLCPAPESTTMIAADDGSDPAAFAATLQEPASGDAPSQQTGIESKPPTG
jgi:hypothetical protein